MRIIAYAASLALVAGFTLASASSASAYQPTQQTIYSAQNPSSCNKSPCILYPKSAQLPSGRLVMGFEDSEGAVVGQTMPIYKSDDYGDTWQKLTDLKAPAYLTSDSAYAAYTSNWTNPYFYVLPQAVGSLAAGTLLLATVVSGADTAPSGSGNRQNVAIVLYASTDQGATWNVISTIASGANQANDPVWEPYLMMYQGQLVCYYSDENDFLGYNSSTGVPAIDPDNTTATDSGGQVLVHKTWNGSGSWSSPVIDVAGDTVTMGGGKTEIGGGRPGMTNIVPTTDGKWLLTYEYWGGGDNVRYKIASSPLQFYATGGAAGTNITALPVSSGSGALARGGSPVLVARPDGSLVYNAAGSADVWVNASGSSSGTWKEYKTSMPSGYSRDLQYVSGTGLMTIIRAPWGTGPVTHAQVDLGNSSGVYYALVNRATGQVLSPQNGNTQDAVFTGNTPDIITQARNDSSATQWWHLERKGTSVTLLNKGGGRAVGIWQGNASAGAKLTQWVDDGGSDKLWNLVQTSDGYYQLQSTANTSLYATAATAGGAVDLENATGTAPQQWQLVIDFTTTSGAYFKVVNRNSSKTLGVYGASTSNGASIVQWTYTGSTDQLWNVALNSNGNTVITNNASAKVVGVYQGSTSQGAQAVQWTNTGATDQQWTFTPSGPYYTVQNVNSSLYLGVSGASTANGANVVQWAGNGSLDQQWQLVQVSGR